MKRVIPARPRLSVKRAAPFQDHLGSEDLTMASLMVVRELHHDVNFHFPVREVENDSNTRTVRGEFQYTYARHGAKSLGLRVAN